MSHGYLLILTWTTGLLPSLSSCHAVRHPSYILHEVLPTPDLLAEGAHRVNLLYSNSMEHLHIAFRRPYYAYSRIPTVEQLHGDTRHKTDFIWGRKTVQLYDCSVIQSSEHGADSTNTTNVVGLQLHAIAIIDCE